MKCRARTVIGVGLAVCLLIATAAGAQSGSDNSTFWRSQAGQDRGQSSNARGRAHQWQSMADKARARAVSSSSGAAKKVWQDAAADDDAQAKRLNDEADAWDQKAREADARAEEAEKQANAVNSPQAGPSAAANANPPMTTEKVPESSSASQYAEGGELRTSSLGSKTDAGPPDAPSDKCECPQIKPVATSDSPATGRVDLEITEADLQDQFSNRELAYKDDWDKAFLALDAAIDPDGKLNLARGPAPPVEDLDAAPLREGFLSRQLIEGQEKPIPPGARLSQAQAYAHNQSIRGSRMLTMMIVNTIARVNKYGSAERYLRDDLLRAERYMLDDLARASVSPSDQRSMFIGSVQGEAFSTLLGLLSVATASAQQQRAKRPPSAPNPRKGDLLSLDDFDRASAALDVYLARDYLGRERGVFTPPRLKNDVNHLVEKMAEVASARREFGGNAVPGSPQDVVSCKAFNTLIRLSDARVPGTARMRAELLQLLADTSSAYSVAGYTLHGASTRPMFAVARSALTVAGVEDDDEARQVADSIIEIMLSNPDGLERMVDVLKFYQAHLGGDAHPMPRDAVDAEVQRKFQIMQKRKDVGTAGKPEVLALERWKIQPVTVGDSQGPQPCCGPPGQCGKELAKETPTVAREDWDTTSQILFRPPGPRAVDATNDSIIADGGFPISVTLRVPTDRASGSSTDITLRNARTGKTQQLHLDSRYDQKNGIFTTYSNTPKSTKVRQSPRRFAV